MTAKSLKADRATEPSETEKAKPRWSLSELPPLMAPEGHGFMPLYSAVHWIAMYGKKTLDPGAEEVWPNAYKELLDAIGSGKIRVIGTRIGSDGKKEEVKPEHFVGCAVQYPHPIEDLDWNFADDELVLRSFPYDDEDDWRDGFSDSLLDRRGQGWSRLMIQEADVRKLWPLNVSARSRTGVAGRPASIYLCEKEFERLIAEGEVAATLKEQGDALRDWFKETHSEEKPVQSLSIQNKIRARYKEVKPTK